MLAMGVYAFNPCCQSQRQEDFYKFEASLSYTIEQSGKIIFSRILPTGHIEEAIEIHKYRDFNSTVWWNKTRKQESYFLKMPNALRHLGANGLERASVKIR